MNRSASRDRILDAAEARARSGGYNGFSFRDLAADVGITSASVHHHFRTKEELTVALAERYRERTLARLGDPREISPPEALERVVTIFRDALATDDRMCLCGLFGAERDALPISVQEATAAYFAALLDYLAAARGSSAARSPAAIVATLEGALIIARTLRRPELFEAAANDLAGGPAPP